MEPLAVYLHLARASELRRRTHVRDRLLIMAAVIASELGLARIAAYCRCRVLEHNPQHLLHRWPTIEAAVEDDEFRHFLRHLSRRYPPERAEQMLSTLEIERGHERDVYFSDEEYAAALLGVSLDKLDELFGPS